VVLVDRYPMCCGWKSVVINGQDVVGKFCNFDG
jgi:selenophosphate synthetase-related protein